MANTAPSTIASLVAFISDVPPSRILCAGLSRQDLQCLILSWVPGFGTCVLQDPRAGRPCIPEDVPLS